MGAFRDLWQSERGLLAVILVLACTTLCALGSLTNEQWLDYTRWLFITYAAAKTITGTAAIVSGQSRQTTSVTAVSAAGAPPIITATTTATTPTPPPATDDKPSS